MTTPAIGPVRFFFAATTVTLAAFAGPGFCTGLGADSTVGSSSNTPAWAGCAFSAAAICCAVADAATTPRSMTPESSFPASVGRGGTVRSEGLGATLPSSSAFGACEGREAEMAAGGTLGALGRAPAWLAFAASSLRLPVRLRSAGRGVPESDAFFSPESITTPDPPASPGSPCSTARGGAARRASRASPGIPSPPDATAAFTMTSARSSQRRSSSGPGLPWEAGHFASRASRSFLRRGSSRLLLRSRATPGTRAASVELRARARPRCPRGNRAPWTLPRARGRRCTRGSRWSAACPRGASMPSQSAAASCFCCVADAGSRPWLGRVSVSSASMRGSSEGVEPRVTLRARSVLSERFTAMR